MPLFRGTNDFDSGPSLDLRQLRRAVKFVAGARRDTPGTRQEGHRFTLIALPAKPGKIGLRCLDRSKLFGCGHNEKLIHAGSVSLRHTFDGGLQGNGQSQRRCRYSRCHLFISRIASTGFHTAIGQLRPPLVVNFDRHEGIEKRRVHRSIVDAGLANVVHLAWVWPSRCMHTAGAGIILFEAQFPARRLAAPSARREGSFIPYCTPVYPGDCAPSPSRN